LIEVKNLKKYFPVEAGFFKRKVADLKAVDGVSFSIKEGESTGLVGESGCGKTTVGRCILRLIEPTEGNIVFEGEDITELGKNELRMVRSKMQLIFQDPYSSLNPRLTIGDIITEPLIVHNLVDRSEINDRVQRLMLDVGLSPSQSKRYPHEFSGGQKQRISIARALSVVPKFIVADEPVAALDMSIRAQILNLMKDLQDKYQLTYLIISHDLTVIKHMCNRIMVMYLGDLVEVADREQLFKRPYHPYSFALISAIPIPDPLIKKKRIILEGDVPAPINPPSGCKFHPRCSYAKGICSEEFPELREINPGHYVSCHFAEEIEPPEGSIVEF
jgi:oligopeptide/dipeptide ABC transporter ATP-binding protein